MSKQTCRKYMKGFLAGMAAAMLVCGSSVVNAEAGKEVADSVVSAAAGGDENLVMPASTVYVWYYKVEDGRVYQRLYDASHGRWVTPWLLRP